METNKENAMLLTLLKALDTTDLKTVVGHLSMSPFDIDLLLYSEQDKGNVEIDKNKEKIKPLKDDFELYYDRDFADKLVQTMKFYDRQGANITRGRLEQNVLDLAGTHGYPVHMFLTTLYALEQNKVPDMPHVYKYVINVPAIKNKRPYNSFEFYTLEEHQEFGAKAVQEFIDQFEKKKVK